MKYLCKFEFSKTVIAFLEMWQMFAARSVVYIYFCTTKPSQNSPKQDTYCIKRMNMFFLSENWINLGLLLKKYAVNHFLYAEARWTVHILFVVNFVNSIILLKRKTFNTLKYSFLTNFASITFKATMLCKPWYLDHPVLVVLSF